MRKQNFVIHNILQNTLTVKIYFLLNEKELMWIENKMNKRS